MARISTYPLDTGIDATDKLLGSDEKDLSTKNFQVSDLTTYFGSQLLGYTSLVQLLNQTGTEAPVATEVYNNTGQTFTWSYVDSGAYRITGTGAPFTANKTIVFFNTGGTSSTSYEAKWGRISDSTIEVRVGDSVIMEGSFEVKIYS